MLSNFWKKPKSQCNYSYEYSYITYGENFESKTQANTSGDSGNIDSFHYFTFEGEKYFIIGDHSGKVTLFNYLTGVKVKSVMIKSMAKGILRLKKFLHFIRDLVEEKENKLQKLEKERRSKGMISIDGIKTETENVGSIIKDSSIIDNYDNVDGTEKKSDEENQMSEEIEEIKRISSEIQTIVKNINETNEEESLNIAEQKIKELENKYGIDSNKEMISSGAIGAIGFTNGTLIIAVKKEIHRIPLTNLMTMKENELIVNEGVNCVHDGIIKKIYIRDNIIMSIANDKKIAFWNVSKDKALYVMERESDDYYKTSLFTDDCKLFITRTNEIYLYQIDLEEPKQSHFIRKLEKDKYSVHNDDVDLIEMIKPNRLMTVSCDGNVAIWDLETLELQQLLTLQVQSNDQRKPLLNISSIVSFKRNDFTTYYLTYGGWIVRLEEKGDKFEDLSPKRVDNEFSLPYGKYNVDVTQLLNVTESIIVAVTADSGMIYILENVSEKKHDSLLFVESRKLSGKISSVHMLDKEEGSFIVTTNEGTVLMLKDSTREMKRRQALFMKEMQESMKGSEINQ